MGELLDMFLGFTFGKNHQFGPAILTVLGSLLLGLLVLVLVPLLCSQKYGKLKGPAYAFAAFRTLGTHEDDDLVKCADKYAKLFTPAYSGGLVALKKLGAKRAYPGLYETVLATTKVSDTQFCELINQNHFRGDSTKRIEQVVVLGADFGTRLVRYEEILKEHGVTSFEVDLFHYQQAKLKTLKAAKVPLEHIRFLETSVDDLGKLEELLNKEGFQSRKTTLWLVEGVLPFLSADLVDSVLQTIKKISGNNCAVILDTVPQLPELADDMSLDSYMYTESAIAGLRSLFPSRLGSFELDMSQAVEWCSARGFELMKNVGPRVQQVQLVRHDGSVVGQIPDCLRVLVLSGSDAPAPKKSSDEATSAKPETKTKTEDGKSGSAGSKPTEAPKAKETPKGSNTAAKKKK